MPKTKTIASSKPRPPRDSRAIGQYARNRGDRRRRRGSLIIEAAVAALLLATATVAVARLAAASSGLRARAKLRLATEFECNNILRALSVSSREQDDAVVARIKADLERRGFDELQVLFEEFSPLPTVDTDARLANQPSSKPITANSSSANSSSGSVHIVVTLSVDNLTVVAQDWRVRLAAEPKTKTKPETKPNAGAPK